MGRERRTFERELVNIPFIFSLEEGEAFSDGEWYESKTVDIGPVLVGGLAFESSLDIKPNDQIRIALFMDLELRKSWQPENETFPIYKGTVCRITDAEGEGKRIAVVFKGFGKKMEEFLESEDWEE